MKTALAITCPPMPVRNTSWWNPWADRLTDNLDCPSQVVLPDGSKVKFMHTFGPCYVRRQGAGRWLVDGLDSLTSDQGLTCRIKWPAEPIQASSGGLMHALAIDSLDGEITLAEVVDGSAVTLTGKIKAHMPESIGRPQGLGMYVYVVDAVVITGTVDWQNGG